MTSQQNMSSHNFSRIFFWRQMFSEINSIFWFWIYSYNFYEIRYGFYASDIKSIKIICDSYIESPHIVDIWPGPGVAGRRRLNDCASSWRCFLGRVVSLAAVLTFRSAWLFFTLCLRFSLLYVHGIFYKLIFVLVNDYEDFRMIRKNNLR